jgi:hypothetical protein
MMADFNYNNPEQVIDMYKKNEEAEILWLENHDSGITLTMKEAEQLVKSLQNKIDYIKSKCK